MIQTKDQIIANVPILKSFPLSVRLCEKVELANGRNSGKEKYLIVAISGVFLLTQKAMHKSYSVLSQISFIEMNLIKLTKEDLTIGSSNTEITIIHQDHIKIASAIYSLREGLFVHSKLPIEVTIDPDLQNDFANLFSPFQSTTILADRFLGAVLDYFTGENCIDELISIYANFVKNSTKFEFTKETLSSQFLKPMIFAVSYGKEINQITIRNLSMESISEYFRTLLKGSRDVTRISMIDIDFNTKTNYLFFSSKYFYHITDFEFTNCDFSKVESKVFFESFSKYNFQIKLISFQSCQFCSETLDILFQALFFDECFHSLETILFRNIEQELFPINLIQLVTCAWVIEKKCIKTLSATKCGIQIDQFLSILLSIDTGILNLDLKGNTFKRPIEVQPKHTFSSLSNLCLSCCEFSGESLLSLFKSLETNANKSIRLDLSAAQIDEETKNIFFDGIAILKIPFLTGLIWEDNEVNDKFIQFIQNQNLTELSLSNSLNDSTLHYLDNVSSIGTLKIFSISSKSTQPLLQELPRYVKEILTKNPIESLDVSNQRLGETFINEILDFPDRTYNELNFNSFSPSSPQAFFSVIDKCIQLATVKHAIWPEADVKSILEVPDMQERGRIIHNLNLIKKRFVEKFGQQGSIDMYPEISDKFFSVLPNSSGRMFSNEENESDKEPTATIKESFEVMKEFTNYSTEIFDILKECGDVTGEDPMQAVREEIRKMISVEMLMKQLRSMKNE
ncbi:Leucine Rich Repeat family protein [Histomonas meleagridis]|uniref:Leucine Rich Repeat family protein n=1 Tax=Histomonas meleagridis TaxID=135588 RepID=UPI0035598B1E|nr:Leucine Rich Repeat family protein [Histomonas meleagridis]KAH0796557.1 Leucine Rich Repeat family protein [Histomonas meleagridis]